MEGDPRFRGVTGNRWKMSYAWVNKEFKNLARYADAGIPVPEPVTFAQNCLLMEFIGDESGPCPQLKDVVLEDPTDTYDEVISFIIDGWRDAHLVHGDLSEYNILMQDGQPIMIDVGQAMTTDHYNARELLERDIRNINVFFRKRGADVIADDVEFLTPKGSNAGSADDDFAAPAAPRKKPALEAFDDDSDIPF